MTQLFTRKEFLYNYHMTLYFDNNSQNGMNRESYNKVI